MDKVLPNPIVKKEINSRNCFYKFCEYNSGRLMLCFTSFLLIKTEILIYTGVEYKVPTTLLSHDDGEFESCQLCRHEQGLLDEAVQPAATVGPTLSIYCSV